MAGVHELEQYSPVTLGELKAGKTVVNADAKTDPRTAEFYEEATNAMVTGRMWRSR